MFDDDPVGLALRDAHPTVNADAVWPEVLRRVRHGRRVRRSMASLAAMALIVAVLGVVVLRGDDSARTITVVNDPSRTTIGPGGVILPVDQRPSSVAVGGGSVWVLTGTVGSGGMPGDAGTLVRVDSNTGSVTAAIPLRGAPAMVAVDDSSVWVSLFNASAVARIDLATNTIAATIPLELPRSVCSNNCAGGKDFLPVNIAVNSAAVWVSTARGYVARIDKEHNTVAAMIATEPDQTQGVAVTKDAVFVGQGNILRIDASTNAISSIASPVDREHGFAGTGAVGNLYASLDHPDLGVWLTAYQDEQRRSTAGIIGVDPETGKAITALIESGLRMVTVNNHIWARGHGSIFTFDPATGTSGPPIAIPEDALVAIDDSNAWWVSPGASELVRTTLAAPHAAQSVRVVRSVTQASTATTFPVAQAPQFRADFDTSQRSTFVQITRAVPDRIVSIDSRTIALEWTSACNQPASRIVFDQRSRTEIELLVGSFLVKDCVGEPTRWHIVVTLPEPLAADVVALGPDDQFTPVRVDRLDNAIREVIRNDFTTTESDTQYTSVYGGTSRFDNRCSRVRITRISNGIEAFYQIEQAERPLADCTFGPRWVPIAQ